MFCSTIIPTINRATLARAVLSVLEQSPPLDDFEVIVVNDSGRPLPETEWQSSPRVKVLATNREERSVARNTGAAVARGRYLHFLDDDDWMLPGALETFRVLAKTRSAAWFYGGYRLVDSAGRSLEERRPDESGNCFVRFMTGEWLPLQVSLIDAEAFAEVGGFASLTSLRGGNEDVHLARRLTLTRGMVGTPELVATIRVGEDESTTDYEGLPAQSRESRERLLRMRGAFARLRDSARTRPTETEYWRGRVVRIYGASLLWNLRRLRLPAAVVRGGTGVAALAAGDLFSTGFWRGVAGRRDPHTGILHFQIENAGRVPERPSVVGR